MDAKVAEAMGWTWELWPLNREQPHLVPPGYVDPHPDVWWLGRSQQELVPPYSTDIRAAWMVANHLGLMVVPVAGDWMAGRLVEDGRVRAYADTRYRQIDGIVEFCCVARSAPLAICKAALLVIAEPT